MTANEIKEFSNLWAYHPPTAIGTFLLFAIIYRSKFFAHKSQLSNSSTNTENEN
jgi:hypothetical protein